MANRHHQEEAEGAIGWGVAKVVALVIGVLVIFFAVGALLAVRAMRTVAGPDRGSTTLSLEELDRIGLPSSATVVSTDAFENSGLPYARRTLLLERGTCLSPGAGLTTALHAAGFVAGPSLDGGGQRWLRDIDGRLTTRADLRPSSDRGTSCELTIGFLVDK